MDGKQECNKGGSLMIHLTILAANRFCCTGNAWALSR